MAVKRQHAPVVVVVLGPDAEALGEALDVQRVGHRHLAAGLMQEQRDGLVVDAGGFEHEAQLPGCRARGALCPGQQQRVPLWAVVDPLGAGQSLLWVAQPGAVQALFADVDADKLHKSCSLNNDNEVIFSTVLPCACRLLASGRASDTVQTRRRSGRWSGGTFFEPDSGS